MIGSRALCGHIRSAHLKSSEPVITIIPNDLVDKNLLVIADSGGQQKSKTGGTFGGGRQKKCHWQNISEWRISPKSSLFNSEYA